ncbi:phage terminase small subunit P27 family [Paracoccus rhizosphaerae]|uniref:Phage terminase small subunit P27 family n=1 Tax=Paracoccus rhizosphaerae TaxID=1133347 RepID=A0ABV6CGZ2_9RHOB|nr:phage terminase small subunit P27 family [Paracoccus rhizosphaerae]
MKGAKPQLREEQDALIDNMAPPDWLSQPAQDEWARVMPVLVERKILTDADLGGLESYCICIGRVRQMETLIQAESDAAAMLPMIRALDKAMVTARQLGAELGLTPVSRSRPAIRDDDDSDDSPSPLDVG